MQIHVMQEGQQFGPYSKPQLEAFLWEGTVQRGDLAWYEGLEDWLPVWQVLEMDPLPGEVEEVATADEEQAPEANPAPSEPGSSLVSEEVPAVAQESQPSSPAPLEASPEPEEAPVEDAPGSAPEREPETSSKTVEALENVEHAEAADPPAAREIETKEGGPRLVIPATVPKTLARPASLSRSVVSPSAPTGGGLGVGGSGGLASVEAPRLPRSATHGWRWIAGFSVLLVILCLFPPFFSVTVAEKKLPGASAKAVLMGVQTIPVWVTQTTDTGGEEASEAVGDGQAESEDSVDAAADMPLVKVCLGLVLLAAGAASLFGVAGARAPDSGHARWGLVSAIVGLLVMAFLAYQLSGPWERDLPEVLARGESSELEGLRVGLDGGFYGMLAALLLGAGACCVPAYRSLMEGGSWMTMAVSLWFLAILSGVLAAVQWHRPALEVKAASELIETLSPQAETPPPAENQTAPEAPAS